MLGRIVNRLEEGVIALLLAAMTLLTFIQVVLRYVFNTGLMWALETVTYMFAWMVLLGISYGVKVGAHIGVDALVRLLPRRGQLVAGLLGALICITYATILLVGSWNYVDQLMLIGVEAEDLPIQRWLLALALPIGFGLLLLRFVQVTWRIVTGRQSNLGLLDETSVDGKTLYQPDGDGPGRPQS